MSNRSWQCNKCQRVKRHCNLYCLGPQLCGWHNSKYCSGLLVQVNRPIKKKNKRKYVAYRKPVRGVLYQQQQYPTKKQPSPIVGHKIKSRAWLSPSPYR